MIFGKDFLWKLNKYFTNYLENNECSYGCLEIRTRHASANVFLNFHNISYIILLVLTQFHLLTAESPSGKVCLERYGLNNIKVLGQ